jgi:hypothetical protein
MKISHPERGGNGVSARVVNQSLPGESVEIRAQNAHLSYFACPGFRQPVAANHHSARTFVSATESF